MGLEGGGAAAARCEGLGHAALRSAPSGERLAAARLTDRQRLGVLLQGAGLLAVLDRSGWMLAGGWEVARIGPGASLQVPHGAVAPGRAPLPAQELVRQLLFCLFGLDAAAPAAEPGDLCAAAETSSYGLGAGGRLPSIAGRGEARRAARQLLAEWWQRLVPVPAGQLAEQILRAAPFLWERAFAAARQAVPGSGERRARDGRRVATPLAAAVRAGAGAVRQGEWNLRTSVALSERGQFGEALAVLGAAQSAASRVQRVICQIQLGRLGAARLGLRRLEGQRLSAETAIAAAEAAVRLFANRAEPARVPVWVKRALVAGRQLALRPESVAWRVRAQLVGALAAWDRGEAAAMDAYLDAARRLLAGAAEAGPVMAAAWRFHHACGLRAMADGNGGSVVEHLYAALGQRRSLARHEAAGLWNDLGIGRCLSGDLAGAERAFLHAQRLFGACDGPRRATLALHNLAEVRLRRGRLEGVREILARSLAENERDGNVRGAVQDAELLARFHLVAGNTEAAVAVCRRALDRSDRRRLAWRREVLLVLLARALGWLQRPEEAALALADVGEQAVADLEPEERPAVWAWAGRLEEARSAARELLPPSGPLWRAILARQAPPSELWQGLRDLEPYRAARLVFDLEQAAAAVRARPTFEAGEPAAMDPMAPAAVREPAIRVLLRLGLGAMAARLAAGAAAPPALAEASARPAALPAATPLAVCFARLAGDLAGGLPAGTATTASTRTATAPPEQTADRRAMVGRSAAMRAAMARLALMAAAEIPVLIRGESGTGKELAARQIHHESRRCRRPFLAINCAAVAESLLLSDLFGHARGAFTGADRERAGVFEAAAGGTVLLDEIGDLPLAAQGLLLRVLQEGEVRRIGESLPRRVDVRLLAATHRDLEQAVTAGAFRQDLYYRLKVGAIDLPPLRERGDDLSIIALELLDRQPYRPPRRLAAAALTKLQRHGWPGNVRELENVLLLAAALATQGVIEPQHLELPAEEARAARSGGSYHQEVEALRRRLVTAALAGCGGRRAEAARRLGISRQALAYLMRELGLVSAVKDRR